MISHFFTAPAQRAGDGSASQRRDLCVRGFFPPVRQSILRLCRDPKIKAENLLALY